MYVLVIIYLMNIKYYCIMYVEDRYWQKIKVIREILINRINRFELLFVSFIIMFRFCLFFI